MLIAVGFLAASLSAESEDKGSAPDTVVEWKIRHFDPQQLRDGTSDDDRALTSDHLPNLLKYAMGLSPWENVGTPLSIEVIEGGILASHLRAEDCRDVDCRLEISPDLTRWTTADSPDQVTVVSAGLTRVQFRTILPDREARFFRLRAERLTNDLDRDSLDDDHELAWFASIAHGPADDPDGDGMTTGEELTLGRSPHRGLIADPQEASAATGLVVFTPLEGASGSTQALEDRSR